MSGNAQRLFALVLTSVAVLSATPTALAGDTQESIRLAYRASAGCPDEADFVARVRARTERAHFVADGEAPRTFDIELSALPTPRGTFTVQDGGTGQGRRTFEADSCDEVADALAVAVALAADPPSSEPPELAQSAAEPPEASAAPSGDAVVPPVSAVPPASPALPTPPAPLVPRREPESAPAQRLVSTRWLSSLFAGADLALAQGVTPNVVAGPSVVVGWRSRNGSSRVGGTLRASAVFAGTDPLGVPGGKAAFNWTVGRADGCLDLIPDRRFRAGACARVEAGVLEVRGADVPAPKDQKTAWMAAGAVLHAEWSLLSFLFLAADAGPTYRAVANRFFFSPPDTTAYRVPVVGFDADAGLGLHFP